MCAPASSYLQVRISQESDIYDHHHNHRLLPPLAASRTVWNAMDARRRDTTSLPHFRVLPRPLGILRRILREDPPHSHSTRTRCCPRRHTELLSLRLISHLDLTGTVSFPRGTPDSKWDLLVQTVPHEFPNPTMDGVVIKRRLWACTVPEVAEYYEVWADQLEELRKRKSFRDALEIMGFLSQAMVNRDLFALHYAVAAHADGQQGEESSPNTSSSSSNTDSSGELLLGKICKQF
ncbi:hypothetical protein DFH09DRAFT_1149922 [Mycena vulgaris]|nr:hypothetical protein DFH09DRAFT_1149922 [Mycena vulgaris]